MKFSLNKKLPAQTEESSKQKEKEPPTSNIIIPSIPTIKKQIMRNNTCIKKIPSSSYTSSSSMTKIKFTNTINYSIKEEKEKINRPKIFKERNSRLKCLKNLKKQFFSGNLILPKPFWLGSGKNTNENIKNKMHKNTFSDIHSFYSFFHYNNYNSNNSNTTANTHNSNYKNKSNSFQKSSNLYKINLKTLSRKNSMKQNYIKKNNNCPIRHNINTHINKNSDKIIKEENKNDSNINSNNNIKEEISAILKNENSKRIYTNDNNEEDNIKRYNNIKYSGEYINDILNNLLQEERDLKIKINENYFCSQPEINDKMRAILIDWIIDVHNKFGLKEETLYITIYIIDCYLSLKKIERCNFQLLGVTSLFIACKQNEIILRRLKEYAYITDNAYNESEIANMENIIFKALDFNILFPSPLSFYEIICYNIGIINDNEKYNLGQFFLQSFFIDSNSLKYSYSTIACAASYIVMKFFKMKNYQSCYDSKIFNIKENKDINKKNNENNNLASVVIKECAKDMCYFVGELSKNNLNAVIRKFSGIKYGNVTNLIFGSLLHNENK